MKRSGSSCEPPWEFQPRYHIITGMPNSGLTPLSRSALTAMERAAWATAAAQVPGSQQFPPVLGPFSTDRRPHVRFLRGREV